MKNCIKSGGQSELFGCFYFEYLDENVTNHPTVRFGRALAKVEPLIDKAVSSIKVTSSKTGTRAGRPGFDMAYMFKIALLQRHLGYSDNEMHIAMLTDSKVQQALNIVNFTQFQRLKSYGSTVKSSLKRQPLKNSITVELITHKDMWSLTQR